VEHVRADDLDHADLDPGPGGVAAAG